MILVDFSAMIHANSHVLERDFAARPSDVSQLLMESLFSSLIRIKRKFGTKYGELCIAIDNDKYWRRSVFPPYKHSREAIRKASTLPWDEIRETVDDMKTGIKQCFPYRLIEVEYAEADDIIGVLTIWSQFNELIQDEFGEKRPQDILIVSGDKDFKQLHRFPNVAQYSSIKDEYFKLTQEQALEQLHELIMRGDRSDGIPNARSHDMSFVDKKKQLPITQQVLAETKTNSGRRYWKAEAGYTRNRRLIDLSQIPTSLAKEIVKEYQKEVPKKNKMGMYNYFLEKNRHLVDRINDF